MRTREVAEICGVTEECIRQNAKKVGIVLENGKAHDYTEDELKRIQVQLMLNAQNNNANASDVVKETSKTVLEVGLIAKACLESPEAWEQFKRLGDSLVEQKLQAKQLEAQNQQLLLDYQKEKEEHQKDKELVLHKYLTATQIKETILREYGKSIVVSKAVQRIPIEDNDILYKPFTNGTYTGQQPVYHPNVLDKIREILG